MVICLLQLNAAVNISSKKITHLITDKYKSSVTPINYLSKIIKVTRKFSEQTLGITGHGVFVDGHYIGFDKIFSLKYKDEYLPLFDSQGMPGEYLKSGIWANYNFRVNKPYVLKTDINKENLKTGLIRYASFWAEKNNVNLESAQFEILLKSVNANFNWEEDLLEKNLSQPWIKVGKITWKNKKAEVVLEDIKDE
jgi:hypothetical protein